MSRWAIIDDDGIIEEGTEEDVRASWALFVDGWAPDDLSGDARLVEIHGVHR